MSAKAWDAEWAQPFIHQAFANHEALPGDSPKNPRLESATSDAKRHKTRLNAANLCQF